MNGAAAAPTKAQSKPHQLPSGGVLHMQRIPFKRADALKKAVIRQFSSNPVTAEEMQLTLERLRASPSAGGALLQRMLAVASSDEVDAAVFSCLDGVALYQPPNSRDMLRVDQELFDHEVHGDAARADQVRIWLLAGEAAVKPFLGALLSAYTAFQKTAAAASGPASRSSSSPAAS